MLKATQIKYIHNYWDILHDDAAILNIRKDIMNGDVYVFKNMIDPQWLLKVRNYLSGIGRNSLPNYHPIAEGAPNFHRLNMWDERAYVKGCFQLFLGIQSRIFRTNQENCT